MRTVAAPMPREPPVIRATLLERERAMDIGEQFPISFVYMQVQMRKD